MPVTLPKALSAAEKVLTPKHGDRASTARGSISYISGFKPQSWITPEKSPTSSLIVLKQGNFWFLNLHKSGLFFFPTQIICTKIIFFKLLIMDEYFFYKDCQSHAAKKALLFFRLSSDFQNFHPANKHIIWSQSYDWSISHNNKHINNNGRQVHYLCLSAQIRSWCDPNVLHLNISHFHGVYTSRSRHVKAWTVTGQSPRRTSP